MSPSSLQTAAEPLAKNRVKLRVEVSEAELKPAFDSVYKKWATDIKVPGFRKGKVPRQIINSRVGVDVIREEALREALPDLYRAALAAEEIEAIAPPDIEVLEFEVGTPLVFEATIELRPEIEIPDPASIHIDLPDPSVTESDLNEQVDRLRDRFAELEAVPRSARRGDFVVIDLKGYADGQPVEGASAPDFLYEVGSAGGPPKLDAELEGNRAGAILKFSDNLPRGELGDQQISFTVLVKEVKIKKLPPADDDFAKTVGDFATLDDLREDLRGRLTALKAEAVAEQTRGLVLEALVDASALEAPVKLVEGEIEHRLQHLESELKGAGLTMADYAERTGSTELQIRHEIRNQASRAVVAELLLEEIARKEEVTVSEEDIGRELAMISARAQREPKEVAEQLASSGRLAALATDIMRRKALDHVVRAINPATDPTDEQV